MRLRNIALGLAASIAVSASLPLAAQLNQTPPTLAYTVSEGRNLNVFFRQASVAAHLLLRSGRNPRVIVAFPAGNSGTGVWFAPLARDAHWRIDVAPNAVAQSDLAGRQLSGVVTQVSIDAPALEPGGAVLSSVRILRDFELSAKQPGELVANPQYSPDSIVWRRNRLDGAAGYKLSLKVLNGRIEGKRILAGADGRIALQITALTGETPLTPLAGSALLNARAAKSLSARHTLEFLSYREKFLAGSWRFNTYFGRDTLMSVRLLMPALEPQAVESGLGSVLARLSPQGEVAHEEDIGEFAVLEHMHRDGSRSDAPIYDYKMIDGTPMLAVVAGHWLLDDPRARPRAAAFLKMPAGNGANTGGSNGAALVANLLEVVKMGAPFAADPRADNMVALKPQLNVGNWRDSEDGLGFGRYPYDVNAVLMPAGLEAAARLEASGLLDPWLDEAGHKALRCATAMARTWRSEAPQLFAVTIPAARARDAVRRSAADFGIAPGPALATIPAQGLQFHAIALGADGAPVPILHSDEGFALLFTKPAEPELNVMLASLMRPFPAGLATDAGQLVANPIYAPQALQQRFTRNAYHGMVVWSWQQALLVAGIDHQLMRRDLSPAMRARLSRGRNRLAATIRQTASWNNSELWSWTVTKGRIEPTAFGAASTDADESNAAQLWSSVFLGLRL